VHVDQGLADFLLGASALENVHRHKHLTPAPDEESQLLNPVLFLQFNFLSLSIQNAAIMSRIFNAFTLSLIFLFVSWAYNTESTVVTEVEIAAHPGEVRKVVRCTRVRNSRIRDLMKDSFSIGRLGKNGTAA
jgi:hypothetical protein